MFRKLRQRFSSLTNKGEKKSSPEKSKVSFKRSSFRKLKKKVLRVESSKGGENYTINVTSENPEEKSRSTSDNSHAPIRRISRAPDGKFHVSEESKSEESQALMCDNGRDEGFSVYSPSRSTLHSSSSAKLPMLSPDDDTPSAQPPAALEIDCSQCDISVRYIKDGNDISPDKITPRLYNLSRRVTEPYMTESPVRGGLDYGSYPSTSDYQQALAPYSRPISSTYVTVSPYAQYVRLRDINERTHQQSPRRISSPPEINHYNPIPVSPSKLRYHKHANQPGGHYHVTPRNSTADGRTETQFYAAGHMSTQNRTNRHSAVVFRNGQPIYQIPPQRKSYNVSQQPTSKIPTGDGKPQLEAQNKEKNHHTLPSKQKSAPMKRSLSHSSADYFRKSTDGYPSLEKSLSFHRANKSANKIYPSGSNSLGRGHKTKQLQHKRVKSLSLLSNEIKQTQDFTPERQRVHSVDDITACQENSNNMQNDQLKPTQSAEKTLNSEDQIKNSKQKSSIGFKTENQSPSSQGTDVSMRHASEGGASSGYESHNTSHTSGSPISLSCQPSHLPHHRYSTASSSDRNRKETSSVDDKYEWDSELVMESEILEALRHYGSQKRTKPVSKALLNEIQKLGSTEQVEPEEINVDSSFDYSKESMDRRCAALKEEYMQYQKDLQFSNEDTTLH